MKNILILTAVLSNLFFSALASAKMTCICKMNPERGDVRDLRTTVTESRFALAACKKKRKPFPRITRASELISVSCPDGTFIKVEGEVEVVPGTEPTTMTMNQIQTKGPII